MARKANRKQVKSKQKATTLRKKKTMTDKPLPFPRHAAAGGSGVGADKRPEFVEAVGSNSGECECNLAVVGGAGREDATRCERRVTHGEAEERVRNNLAVVPYTDGFESHPLHDALLKKSK